MEIRSDNELKNKDTFFFICYLYIQCEIFIQLPPVTYNLIPTQCTQY